MARRDPRAKSSPSPGRGPSSTAPAPEPFEANDTFGWLGERLRRLALGLTAMLLVARAYYPSEDAPEGPGLVWVFAVLGVSALAVASWLLSGTTRLRWSPADAAVLALAGLVALAGTHAAQRRPAITMAWEWGGLALLYFLARNLPRTRAESATFAAALVATAAALSCYGFYQVGVEFPTLRRMFTSNPDRVFFRLGIPPVGPAAEGLRHRLMDSHSPTRSPASWSARWPWASPSPWRTSGATARGLGWSPWRWPRSPAWRSSPAWS